MRNKALFETRDLTKHFRGLKAVRDVNIKINEGEIFGLIGPNGAGKTTIFNLVSGALAPTRGKVLFNGEEITHLKPHEIVRRGLCRTFQLTTVFKNCSVLENVLIGCNFSTKVNLLKELFWTRETKKRNKAFLEKSLNILEFMGLLNLKNELAKNLPYGLQRVLGVSIAMATEPKLLLLDEPMAGLNPEESRSLMKLISKIRNKGITILLVEHDMQVVMGNCERIVVVNHGEKIAEGSPDIIKKDKNVIEAYLGVEEYATA